MNNSSSFFRGSAFWIQGLRIRNFSLNVGSGVLDVDEVNSLSDDPVEVTLIRGGVALIRGGMLFLSSSVVSFLSS